MSLLKKQVGARIAAVTTLVLAGFLVLALCLHALFGTVSGMAPDALALVSLGALTIVFCLIVLLSHAFVSRPLMELGECMGKVEAGILDAVCPVPPGDELGAAAEGFNRMVRGLNEMNETRKRIEERLIKTEESLKYRMALEDKSKIIERMNAELTDAFNSVALLYTVSQWLNTALDRKELIANVKRVFEEKFACDQYALYFAYTGEDELQLACCKGFGGHDRWQEHRVRFGRGIAGMVAERGRTFHSEDLAAEPESGRERTELEALARGSLFAVPLSARGTLIGVLLVVRFAPRAFTPTDRQSLQSIASQIAVAYDRCQLYSRTKELAIRDELTGLYNRRHFQHLIEVELKRAERHQRRVVLLMIDVDHFKRFNDTYGHLRGDEMLKSVSNLLRKSLREVDVVARFGGEEFVVMLTDTGLSEGVGVADKLRELVKLRLRPSPYPAVSAAPEAPPGVTISVGVSAYPDCAANAEELVNSADMALYLAKRHGRDRVQPYRTGNLPLDEFLSTARK